MKGARCWNPEVELSVVTTFPGLLSTWSGPVARLGLWCPEAQKGADDSKQLDNLPFPQPFSPQSGLQSPPDWCSELQLLAVPQSRSAPRGNHAMDPEPLPLPHQKPNDQVRLEGWGWGDQGKYSSLPSLKSLETLSFLVRVGKWNRKFGSYQGQLAPESGQWWHSKELKIGLCLCVLPYGYDFWIDTSIYSTPVGGLGCFGSLHCHLAPL